MDKSKKMVLVILMASVVFLTPVINVAGAFQYWSAVSGSTPSPGWVINVKSEAVWLDAAQGRIQGIINFQLQPRDFEEAYIDKAYLWVDTIEKSARSWSRTYSRTQYNVEKGDPITNFQIVTSTLSSGVASAPYYSCTVWIRLKLVYDGPLGSFTTTLYIAHQPLFLKYLGTYYAAVPSNYIQVSASPPANAAI